MLTFEPPLQIFYDEDNTATLIIREVFPEDAGLISVVAKNTAGNAVCSAMLTVEPPLSDHGSDNGGVTRRSLSRLLSCRPDPQDQTSFLKSCE